MQKINIVINYVITKLIYDRLRFVTFVAIDHIMYNV